MKFEKNKTLAGIITGLVIALLIIAGPVQGFNLGITLSDNRVDKGEDVVFNVELIIESGEGLPVEYLILELDGSEYMECKFSVDGEIISGCKGVKSIVDTKQVSYGYGYGYGKYNNYGYYFGYGYGYGYNYGMPGSNGKLSYEITIDTSDYKTGFYNTKFIAKIGDELFSETGDDLKINFVYSGNKKSGNSETPGCRTEWRCTEWSDCSINGYQNRLCEKVRVACYAGESPEILRACEVNEIEDESESGNRVIDVGNQEETGNSGITGAVTGEGVNKPSKLLTWMAVLFVLIILVLLGVLSSKRLRKNKGSGY